MYTTQITRVVTAAAYSASNCSCWTSCILVVATTTLVNCLPMSPSYSNMASKPPTVIWPVSRFCKQPSAAYSLQHNAQRFGNTKYIQLDLWHIVQAISVAILSWRSLPHLQDNKFALVASGINRGDNCGLHVIYSGTVGAAREAACKVVHRAAVQVVAVHPTFDVGTAKMSFLCYSKLHATRLM